MDVPRKLNPKVWRRVYPDMYIWRNMVTGEYIAIHGSRDKAWFTVKKTVPLYKDGEVVTINLSPYFVLPVKPIGSFGTESNLRIRETEVWKPGTFGDALRFAFRYMNKTETAKTKRWEQVW
jgi:hypothetical protein